MDKLNMCNTCLKTDVCKRRKPVTKCVDYSQCEKKPPSPPTSGSNAVYPKNKISISELLKYAKEPGIIENHTKNDRDFALLSAIDDMIADAPHIGVCSVALRKVKEEVLFIMGERDGLKEALKNARI